MVNKCDDVIVVVSSRGEMTWNSLDRKNSLDNDDLRLLLPEPGVELTLQEILGLKLDDKN